MGRSGQHPAAPLLLAMQCFAALILDALPAHVREHQHDFSTCAVCRRVFWEGSHWRHMLERLAKAVSGAGGEQALTPGEPSILR